jgi:4,5-dihydroxyphthalate decarboxylase
MTAAIWIRGLLRHDHGVDLSAIQWVEGAMESPKPHGRPTVLPPLKPVTIVSNTSGKSLSQLLEQGDVQAVIGADLPSSFGKSPHIKRLFPDFREDAVAELVGIEGGVVSGVFNLESSGVEAPDWRPRHDKH